MLARVTHLDAESLNLKLCPADSSQAEAQYIRLAAIEELRGGLDTASGQNEVHAEVSRTLVRALRLVFGKLVLLTRGGSQLVRATAQYRKDGDAFSLDSTMDELVSPELIVEIGTVRAAAHTRLEEVRLRVDSGGGMIEATTARFADFSLRIGSMLLTARHLDASQLRILWGDSGFRLSASELFCPQIQLTLPGIKLIVDDLRAGALHVHDADWSLREVTTTATHLDTELALPEVDDSGAPEVRVASHGIEEKKSSHPLFDWSLLDHLNGYVNVDVGVVLKVPVIQQRRAMHELRLELTNGRLNFRQIEAGLSTLESSFLDFSVREDELVLELGIPLLPTRGLGHPLVRFPLTKAELAWAQQDWVHLSTLSSPQTMSTKTGFEGSTAEERALVLAKDDASSNEPRVSLQQLHLLDLDARLSIAAPTHPVDAAIRLLSLVDFRLQGEVIHQPSGPPAETRLQGSAQHVALEIDDFPIGDTIFDIRRLKAPGRSEVEVKMLGAKPRSISLTLGGLRAGSIDAGRYARDTQTTDVRQLTQVSESPA